MTSYSHVLRTCAKTAKQREKKYGDASQNLQNTSDICRVTFGLEISTQDIAKVLIALKYARDLHQPDPENLTDAINYTAILSHLSNDDRR